MKTKTFVALFVCALAASAIAQAPEIYTAAEAAKHVGEIATVTDRVDGVHQSSKGNIFLNMGGKYPNQAFTAWIPSASAGQFSNPQQYERAKPWLCLERLPCIGGNRKSSSQTSRRLLPNRKTCRADSDENWIDFDND
jgi:hypothetical protein